MDTDVVLQIVAIILQFAQLRGKFFIIGRNEPLEKNIPTPLVALPEIGVEERLAQQIVAVRDHFVNLAEGWLRLRDELKSLAAETQPSQRGVEIIELLAGIFNLLVEAMDKILDQLLFGQSALLGDTLFILGQFRFDVAGSLA